MLLEGRAVLKGMADGSINSDFRNTNTILAKLERENDALIMVYNFDVDKGELGKALDNSYKNAQDVASDKYINPTARFQGSIVKDVNGTIIGIVFAQV